MKIHSAWAPFLLLLDFYHACLQFVLLVRLLFFERSVFLCQLVFCFFVCDCCGSGVRGPFFMALRVKVCEW